MTIAPLAGMGGMMAPQMQQPPKRGGMFGAGKVNIGEVIAAALSGALAARGNPAGAMGLQMLNQRRQQAMESEQYGQRREDDFQDWVRKQAYQAANKPADVPDIAERVGYLNQLKPGLGDTYAQNYAQNGGSAFGRIWTDPATGQTYSLGGQGGGAPQIGEVVDDPRKGGPMPQASGGFRGPY